MICTKGRMVKERIPIVMRRLFGPLMAQGNSACKENQKERGSKYTRNQY